MRKRIIVKVLFLLFLLAPANMLGQSTYKLVWRTSLTNLVNPTVPYGVLKMDLCVTRNCNGISLTMLFAKRAY
jgi:hypothetical protein